MLRTPLLPQDTFEAWGSGLLAATSGAATSEAAASALEADVALLRRRLLEQLRRPEVSEALLLAAPGLAREAREWLKAPLTVRVVAPPAAALTVIPLSEPESDTV